MSTPRKSPAWSSTLLTEARQVTEVIGYDPDDWPSAGVGVEDHYRQLRAARRSTEAIDFLGHALPRVEAVAWAGHLLDEESRRVELCAPARRALDTALRWLGDPGEAHRRAARTAADALRKPVPERYLALAVFYSGGSIAQLGQPATLPPPNACARFATGAIEQAAYRSADPTAFLVRAFAFGEAVAERGRDALQA